MGQTYLVTLKVKFADKAKAIKGLNEYLWDNFGVRKDTFDECVGVMLAEHQNSLEKKTEKDTDIYSSFFDASYGWENILYEMFKAMKDGLAKGSKLTVYPDNGCWSEVV